MKDAEERRHSSNYTATAGWHYYQRPIIWDVSCWWLLILSARFSTIEHKRWGQPVWCQHLGFLKVWVVLFHGEGGAILIKPCHGMWLALSPKFASCFIVSFTVNGCDLEKENHIEGHSRTISSKKNVHLDYKSCEKEDLFHWLNQSRRPLLAIKKDASRFYTVYDFNSFISAEALFPTTVSYIVQ